MLLFFVVLVSMAWSYTFDQYRVFVAVYIFEFMGSRCVCWECERFIMCICIDCIDCAFKNCAVCAFYSCCIL